MNEKFHEELSALMDGELSELELRRVVRQCAEEPGHMAQWYRMHRVRSVLRGEHREPGMCITSLDLTARVSAALDKEAAHEPSSLTASSGQVPARASARWYDTFIKPLASVAVAASVSAMVVVGWQSVNGVPGAPGASGLAQNSPPATTLVSQTHNVRGGAMPVAEFQSVSRTPARIAGSADMEIIRIDDQSYNERLRRYLISHSGNAAQHTASGTYSYARAVSLKPAGAPVAGTPAAGAPAAAQP